MTDGPMRESTLEECLAHIPESHLARRQLAQKDRELEQANKRAAAAEAKLALVKAHWGKAVDDDPHGCGLSGSYMEEFDAILADTPEVLARGKIAGATTRGNGYLQLWTDCKTELKAPDDLEFTVTRRNGDNGSGE